MDPQLRLASSCGTPEEEFWYHVSSQDELPLAAAKPRPEIAKTLEEFLKKYGKPDLELRELIAAELLASPHLLDELRALISISDKRLYLDLSYHFSRQSHGAGETLCGCIPSRLTRHQTSFFLNLLRSNEKKEATAELIADYLIEKGLGDIVQVYSALAPAQRTAIVESLIAPKESQQQEAKLRGHGPEAALARLLSQLGLSVRPVDKAANPMAEHDPNVSARTMRITNRDSNKTFSCDIVIVNDNGDPLVCIVSLIHSSDPGQFGVDKANTVANFKRAIDRFNRSSDRQVELWGLVDGVGYSENKNGTINAMLPHFDCFLQLKSLWKAALRLHALGLVQLRSIYFCKDFYDDHLIEQLQHYVPDGVSVISRREQPRADVTQLCAGCAHVYLDS